MNLSFHSSVPNFRAFMVRLLLSNIKFHTKRCKDYFTLCFTHYKAQKHLALNVKYIIGIKTIAV